MDGESLLKILIENKDSERAVHMKAYLLNPFVFLGLPTVERPDLMPSYFQVKKKTYRIDWDFGNIFLGSALSSMSVYRL